MVANVVFLILGAVIGIALGYFFATSRKTVTPETNNSELITLRQDAASSRTQVDELTRRLEDAEHRAAGLIQFQTQAAAAQARAQQLEVQLSKMESSAKQNSDVLEILTPIRQQLEQMHDRVDSMEQQRAEQHGKLSQQLEEAAKRDDGIATANAEQTTSIIKALVPVRTELEEMQKRVRLMEQQRSAEHANLTEQLKATAKRETELALAAQKSTAGTDSVLGLLKPVQSHLENLGKRIDEMEQQRALQHGVLDTRLKQAEQREAELVQATNSLTGALRSRSARGTWGEVELVRVLEAAGMLNHVDFAQQQSIGTLVQGGIRPTGTAGADNDRSRPDVTIFLPGGGFLAVDSKTPMDAYLRATDVDGVGEQADSARRSFLVQHAKALRSHIDDLHNRDYAAALGSSPDDRCALCSVGSCSFRSIRKRFLTPRVRIPPGNSPSFTRHAPRSSQDMRDRLGKDSHQRASSRSDRVWEHTVQAPRDPRGTHRQAWEEHSEERSTIQWGRQLSRKAIPRPGTPNYRACRFIGPKTNCDGP